MKITLISLLTLFTTTLFAQEGELFPSIEVVDLNENKSTIPEDTKGKFTLVGIAFSEDAQNDLYSWSQPVFSEFMDDNNLSSLVYDPYVKLILMFGGANQLVYKKAKEQITQGTDETLKDNVVMYKGSIKDYRKILKLKNRKTPYFFVLDKEGKIIYTTEGRYSRQQIKEVGNLIEE
ncbi:MAG: hypothetical protein CMC96_02765 [Flavobacteriales bacterium]|nr:hypothetical protein [Flavobacteriales bacterium]|tara:strand:- start:12410 stop:12940 length:531 start_codon:yes stop_codon:yes gene_type:complete